jgi:hypothetical protein
MGHQVLRRLAMTITDRNLKEGMQLEGRYKKETYYCRVEVGEDGKLAFVLEDGRRFQSVSAAASALMDGKAVNGWLFWSVLAAGAAPAEPKPARKARPKQVIYRMPNQKGIAAGKERWYCNGCLKSFIVDKGEEPAACPAGHGVALAAVPTTASEEA